MPDHAKHMMPKMPKHNGKDMPPKKMPAKHGKKG